MTSFYLYTKGKSIIKKTFHNKIYNVPRVCSMYEIQTFVMHFHTVIIRFCFVVFFFYLFVHCSIVIDYSLNGHLCFVVLDMFWATCLASRYHNNVETHLSIALCCIDGRMGSNAPSIMSL